MFELIQTLLALLYTQYNDMIKLTQSLFDTTISLRLLYHNLINSGNSTRARLVFCLCVGMCLLQDNAFQSSLN